MKPEDILQLWLTAANQADVEKLAGLYHEQAVLIPTFSNRFLNTPEKIRQYFEMLVGREDLSVTLHEKTVMQQRVSDEVCALSGIYCWRFKVDGEPLSFEARFSYLISVTSEKPILQHHSSQVPRML